jgi:agmatinase
MYDEFFSATSIDDAEIVLIGIPYDGTVSFRPGSRFGPQAIRNVLDGIESYSPYQELDMADYDIFDYGDIELCFGNTERVLKTIKDTVEPLYKDGKKVLAIGGEHLVTLPLVQAALCVHETINIIQFDAHVDMRDDYLGEKLSHACVMRRVGELVGFANIYQFGIRSGTKEEWEFSRNYSNIFPFNIDAFCDVIKSFGPKDPIYLTIDIDVLDPSYLPGTGTPEPCGISTRELISAIGALQGKNIIGADIVELSPDYDPAGISSITASHIVREVTLIL